MGRPFVGLISLSGGSRHQGGPGSMSGLPKKIIVTLSHWMTLIQILAIVDMSPDGLGRLGSRALSPRCLTYQFVVALTSVQKKWTWPKRWWPIVLISISSWPGPRA